MVKKELSADGISDKRALYSYKKLMKVGKKVLNSKFDKQSLEQIEKDSTLEFLQLKTTIPYIGGSRNSFTGLLINAAVVIALFRVLKSKGISNDEFGHILDEIAKEYMQSYPRWLRMLMGRMWMSRWFRKVMHKKAIQSQQRRYRYDFVFEIVSKGKCCTWGLNYLECGIVKFLKKHNETELIKYVCSLTTLCSLHLACILIEQKRLQRGMIYAIFDSSKW